MITTQRQRTHRVCETQGERENSYRKREKDGGRERAQHMTREETGGGETVDRKKTMNQTKLTESGTKRQRNGQRAITDFLNVSCSEHGRANDFGIIFILFLLVFSGL